ncbi:MAG TPA: methionyl-tRNA formyltransferase, partial [candidate division Zixibacteria bacterium]|nr:methionyl-tRNA formyltransferase [candidate division Zixibacteria bacterium]
MNVVYLGTPEFAVGPLQALAQSQHTTLCVVTGPDKQSGRGRTIAPTPVKRAALELNLPVLTPRSLKDPQLLRRLRDLDPEL